MADQTRIRMTFQAFSTALVLSAATLAGATGCQSPGGSRLHIADWRRGVVITAPQASQDGPPMSMYLWFYEWNMFDAVESGEHTSGSFKGFRKTFAADGSSGALESDDLTLKLRAGSGVVDLALTIWNRSDHDWPETAAIIPCFNPSQGAEANQQFVNENTWFIGPGGLHPLKGRAIHFNQSLSEPLRRISEERRFVFSDKWPTSQPAAATGLMIRESLDHRWVTGIAWERFLSVQGHNPWNCMHHAVLVGPLARGERRTVRGRIYLFEGSRQDCWRRYQQDEGLAPLR